MAALHMRRILTECFDDPTEKEILRNANAGLFGGNTVSLALIPTTRIGITMGIFHGLVYVVIEGWKEIGLSDPEIDKLLASPNVDLLRRFRNGVFHFQGDGLVSDKLAEFCKSPDAFAWVTTLMKAYGRYFAAEMQRVTNAKPDSPPPTT